MPPHSYPLDRFPPPPVPAVHPCQKGRKLDVEPHCPALILFVMFSAQLPGISTGNFWKGKCSTCWLTCIKTSRQEGSWWNRCWPVYNFIDSSDEEIYSWNLRWWWCSWFHMHNTVLWTPNIYTENTIGHFFLTYLLAQVGKNMFRSIRMHLIIYFTSQFH